MFRTSLLHDVSINELLTMRDSGMTNAEIAKSLDTTPATIRNYIGKQPAELRKKKRNAESNN